MLGVLPGGPREPLHALEPHREIRLGRGLLQTARRIRKRARRIAERPLGDGRRLHEDPELALGRFGVLRLDVEDAEQLVLIALRFVERAENPGGFSTRARVLEKQLERGATRRVRRIDRERLAVGVEGGRKLGQLGLPHRAEAREEREAIDGRLGEAELRLERLRQILPAIRDLVERLQRAKRRALRAKVIHDRAVREDRLGHIRELVGEDRRRARHEHLARVTIVGLSLAHAQDVDEHAPVLRPFVQAIECGERALVGRILVEASAPGAHGVFRAIEHGVVELTEPPVDLAPRGDVVFELHFDLEDARELHAVAGGGVNALERAARGQRDRRVVGGNLEDLRVHALGARRVVELVFVDARDVAEDLGARKRRARGGGRLGEHLGRAFVGPESARDFEHARARTRVVGIDGHEARKRLESASVIAKALVAKLGHAPEEHAPFARRLHELEMDLEHAHQIRDLVTLGVHRLEHNRRTRA